MKCVSEILEHRLTIKKSIRWQNVAVEKKKKKVWTSMNKDAYKHQQL